MFEVAVPVQIYGQTASKALAEMLAMGSVLEVRAPDLEEEALRGLSGLRSVTARDLAHARQHFDEPALQFTYNAAVEQAGTAHRAPQIPCECRHGRPLQQGPLACRQ
jgi:hypothetical protein